MLFVVGQLRYTYTHYGTNECKERSLNVKKVPQNSMHKSNFNVGTSFTDHRRLFYPIKVDPLYLIFIFPSRVSQSFDILPIVSLA